MTVTNQQWDQLAWMGQDIVSEGVVVEDLYCRVLNRPTSSTLYIMLKRAQLEYDAAVLRFLQKFLTFLKEGS